VKTLLIILGILVLVPCMALAQGSYYVDYYSNNVDYHYDQVIRIINVGTLGTPLTSPSGDICANVYVFDANQEMLVNSHVTVTGVVPPSGVIKVVLAQPPGTNCNPTTIGATPDAGLGAVFGTHLQLEHNSIFVTETQKQASTLSSQEQSFLQQACSFALYLGSGYGNCSLQTASGDE